MTENAENPFKKRGIQENDSTSIILSSNQALLLFVIQTLGIFYQILTKR